MALWLHHNQSEVDLSFCFGAPLIGVIHTVIYNQFKAKYDIVRLEIALIGFFGLNFGQLYNNSVQEASMGQIETLCQVSTLSIGL